MAILVGMPKRLSATSRRLSLTGFFLIGVTIAAAGLAVSDRYAETLTHSRSETAKLSVVLGEQTARSIQAIDLVLQEMQAKVPVAGIGDPEEFNRVMGTPALHEFLLERVKNLPQARGIGLVGSNGWLVNGSRFWPIPQVDLSDRDYYRHFREHDDAGLYISSPARDLVSGQWTFFLARRVNGANGEFAGIVLGLADAQYFEDFYRNVRLEPGTNVTLMHTNGTLVARFPPAEAAFGQRLPLFDTMLAAAAAGHDGPVRTAGPVDGATTAHYHRTTEELYLVVEGSGRLEIDGEELALAAGEVRHGMFLMSSSALSR